MYKLREESAYKTVKEHGGDSIGQVVEGHLRREVSMLCGAMDVRTVLEGAKEASIFGNLGKSRGATLLFPQSKPDVSNVSVKYACLSSSQCP